MEDVADVVVKHSEEALSVGKKKQNFKKHKAKEIKQKI